MKKKISKKVHTVSKDLVICHVYISNEYNDL